MAFLNEAELRQAIEGGLATAITSTISAIHGKNEEEIDTIVYGSYAPSWYGRTMDFTLLLLVVLLWQVLCQKLFINGGKDVYQDQQGEMLGKHLIVF